LITPHQPPEVDSASSAAHLRRALVLAINDGFAVGAETLLFSLLRYNPWFDARVIVLSDGLGAKARELLSRLYAVEFVEIDPALKSAARRLERTRRVRNGSSLYSLQVFGLTGLDRAVFMDADTICLGDVRALFEANADFTAAPDLTWLRRAVLESADDRPAAQPRATPDRSSPYGRPLAYSFNSGVFSVSRRWLSPQVYRDLLELPGLNELPDGAHPLTDQYVLNRYFADNVTPLDVHYNFVVAAESLSRKHSAITLPDLRILHFAGYSKPWEFDWDQARTRVPPTFLRYFECWYELREQLSGELSIEKAWQQHRTGLEQLSMAARGTQR
jgi:lipopolysaccharide biosynthesis glycosyltransferase